MYSFSWPLSSLFRFRSAVAVAAHFGPGPRAIPPPENRQTFQFLRTLTVGQDVENEKTLSVLFYCSPLIIC